MGGSRFNHRHSLRPLRPPRLQDRRPVPLQDGGGKKWVRPEECGYGDVGVVGMEEEDKRLGLAVEIRQVFRESMESHRHCPSQPVRRRKGRSLELKKIVSVLGGRLAVGKNNNDNVAIQSSWRHVFRSLEEYVDAFRPTTPGHSPGAGH
ncbi:hypothetical protein F3Y22_tig00110160pilonHSYRG00186 [Hibiscus syriacus]|uniref:Uncharacterized protein n=1 Tax=Hibiscus syriacus TaxID=106335 RepID=A0A6A3BLK0_HIBSY|nr:hypothetical protein F3Y22_tig00110160pilonHSYRG00186 [Hibiscus syriacus]